MNSNLFFALIFCAVVVEGIITYAKTLFVDKRFQWQMLAGICLGVLVTVAYNIDLFSLVGLQPGYAWLSWLGAALTGVLVARGSNYVFDLVKLLGELTVKFKALEPHHSEEVMDE